MEHLFIVIVPLRFTSFSIYRHFMKFDSIVQGFFLGYGLVKFIQEILLL